MRVVVAGTFGLVHDGHQRLFETALRYGEEVVVAVTSDELARASRTRAVPPFAERMERVEQAVATLNEWHRSVDFRTLDDEHGFAATDPHIDALVVSPETAPELADINERRRDRGLEPIEGIVAPYVLADDGERISSTRIVAGEINEHGTVLDANGS